MRRYFLLVLALATLVSSCVKEPMVSGTSPETPGYGNQNEDYYSKGWVRIRLTDDSAPLQTGVFTRGSSDSGDPELDALAAKYGATEIRRVFSKDDRFTERHRRYGLHLWFDVKFDESIAVSRAQSDFGSLPGIAHAQPIYKIYSTETPDYLMPSKVVSSDAIRSVSNQRVMPFDDPGLPLQWHYDNDGSLPLSKAGADLGLFEAWAKFGAGDPSVIVAIMDHGVDFNHEDLAANMWVNEKERDGIEGFDDDGNGKVDDIYGYNYSELVGTGTIIPASHGTHVAGTVAAVNNNDIGVCGVAGGTGKGDGARIMSIQILDAAGQGVDYPDSYRYAADNGAVINQNSWNYSPRVTEFPEDMRVAMDYFIDNAGTGANGEQTGPMKGGVIIFSAGNDNMSRISWPAAYHRIISVTSMLPNYAKAGYSNYGEAADIMAPGGAGSTEPNMDKEYKVYSTTVNNEYTYMAGTSMSAPHVSGMAALIVSHFGVDKPFTADQLKEILLKSHRSVGEYQMNSVVANGIGVGLADASLFELEDPRTAPANPASVTVETVVKEESKLHVFIKVPADGNGMAVSQFKISYAPKGSSEWNDVPVLCRMSVGEKSEYVIGNLQHETTYVFRVSAVDRFGNKSVGFTEGEGTTNPHVNLFPEIVSPLKRVDLHLAPGEPGDRPTAEVNVSENFSDPDLPNDALTFTAVSKDLTIATVTDLTGGRFLITGKKEGSTVITVTATDRAGAFISKNMQVNVTEKDGGTVEPPIPPTPEDKVELPVGEFRLSNPASDLLTIQIGGVTPGSADLKIYDSGARLLLTSSVPFAKKPETTSVIATTSVATLSAGTYTAIVDLNGVRYKSTFIKK